MTLAEGPCGSGQVSSVVTPARPPQKRSSPGVSLALGAHLVQVPRQLSVWRRTPEERRWCCACRSQRQSDSRRRPQGENLNRTLWRNGRRFYQRGRRPRFPRQSGAETTVFVRPYATFVSLVFAPSQPERANANSSATLKVISALARLY